MSESDSTPNRSTGRPEWDAMARHLAGEGTDAEAGAVAAWLAAHPEDARALQLLESAAARLADRTAANVDVEAALAQVHDRMRTPVTPMAPRRAATSTTRRPLIAWGLAAAAVLVIAVGVARSRGDGAAAAPSIVATTVGQVDTVRLADGSAVVLAPASELTVRADFASGRREVRLRGAAFFTVTHDATRSFTVQAGNALITDIGTAFAVRSDSVDGVEVSVAEGAVRLRSETGSAVDLAAGDLAELRTSGAITVQRAGAAASDSAWTSGRLIFRETPLARVRTDLRRWYGVELVLADSTLASRHLTATFQHDSRRQVLEVIALALGATYTERGDTVTLRLASLTVRPRR